MVNVVIAIVIVMMIKNIMNMMFESLSFDRFHSISISRHFLSTVCSLQCVSKKKMRKFGFAVFYTPEENLNENNIEKIKVICKDNKEIFFPSNNTLQSYPVSEHTSNTLKLLLSLQNKNV